MIYYKGPFESPLIYDKKSPDGAAGTDPSPAVAAGNRRKVALRNADLRVWSTYQSGRNRRCLGQLTL